MGVFFKDLKHSVRIFQQNVVFTITVVVALALGIGANTAVFSVVNTVLLKPLPYRQPDRIVRLIETHPSGNGTTTTVPKFMVWREQTDAFEDVAAYDFAGPGVNVTGGDFPELVRGIHVSADYFRLFGASVTIGRTFTSNEDLAGGPNLVVITNGLWRRRFAADPGLVGKTIDLGGEPFVVIGVLDPSFASDPPADVYLPMQADPNSTVSGASIFVAARLRPGITLQKAKAAMKLAAAQYQRKLPATMDPEEGATAEPLLETVVGDVRTPLLVIAGAVAFVLLIACANVANLLLIRATTRRREIAIRAALGAARGRLIRQLLTESVLLSLAGGVLGLLAGYLGMRAVLADSPASVTLLNPGHIPRIGEHGTAVTLNWHVLIFTFLISVITGIVFGLLPAFNASRSDLNVMLRESGSRTGHGPRQNKVRSILVITEMALALVLLVGAALMVRTFIALRNVRPGFDSHNVLTMQMSLAGSRFEKTADVARFVRAASQRIESLPGVVAAASALSLPLEPSAGLWFTIEGRPASDSRRDANPQWRHVSTHFFEVFRIPLLRGRMFTDRDDAGAGLVVLINEAMAKKYWLGDEPLGRRITIGKGLLGPGLLEGPRQIIGIVGDVRNTGLDQSPEPTMYVPVAQVADGLTALINRTVPICWAIRTTVEPHSLATSIQRELRVASVGLPAAHVRSMEDVIADNTQRTDFNKTLLSVFAGIALLLAAVGIYGVIAYSVQQRTQEIGIRMALGAVPRDVRNLVVFQGLRMILAGVAIGIVSALGLTRFIASFLFGVKPWDPEVFMVVPILLSAVALLAVWIPARRASRIDTIEALRCE